MIQFAFFLPFSTIYTTPQIAQAEDPAPVSPPTPGSVGMTFLSENQGRILVKYYYSDGDNHVRELNFDRVGPLTSGSETAQSKFMPAMWTKISAAGITTNFIVYRYSSDPNKYLIIGKKNSTDAIYYNCGLHYKSTLTLQRYEFTSLRVRNDNTGHDEELAGFTNGPINSTDGTTGYFGKKINTTASVDQLCSQLRNSWPKLIEDMKSIIGADPKDTPDYWDQKSPPGWQKAIGIGAITSAMTMGGPIASGLVAGGTALINRLRGYDGSYFLNDAGMTKAAEINTLLDELKTIGEGLKTDADTWPNDDCRPAKITDALEASATEFFASPSEFISFCVELKKIFADAIKNADTDSDDACGSGLTNISRIFPWLFCKAAEIVHYAAVYVIGKSVDWLEASIGIDEITFEQPNATLDSDSFVDHETTLTREQIQAKAITLCNQRKPSMTADDWNKGPCLTNNIENTGYAVDVAHSPRTEVDDENTCSSPAKWIELSTNCRFLRASD